MAERRRRRQRSDVSSEEEEDNVWSGSEATASEYESDNESDKTDEELSRLNETPATDKEDNGVPTPEVLSDAEKEVVTDTPDKVKAKSDSVEEVNGKEYLEEEQAEEEGEEEGEGKEEIEEEKEDNEDESENEDEEKEKSDEESPTHVPKKGMFYQHDDRNYVDPGEEGPKRSRGSRVDNTGRVWGGKKEPKWSRDLFKEEDQRPKEDWEKLNNRPRRKTREGPPKKHRESEFKHHVELESRRPPNPYIQREVSEEAEEEPIRDRHKSREGRGRGKHRSSEDQQAVGEVDIGKESYRRPNQISRDRDESSGDKSQPERRKAGPRARSLENDKTERDDKGRSRGGRRREYKPQKFDRQDVIESYNGKPSENPVDREPVSERGRGKRRGSTRNNTDRELEYEYKQRGRDYEQQQRPRDTNKDNEQRSRDPIKDYDQNPRDTNVEYERDRDRQSGARRRGGNRDRRPRYRDYDSDEEERYESVRRIPKRGRDQHDDEIWKQLEQLKLDQLKLGLQVAQSRYRDESNLVGKGRSRHTRTSPNQNSLIYKIAQEKAQEMAANQSNSSPTESDQEERIAVAYEDPEQHDMSDVQAHTDSYRPLPHPKFTSSTVQTEGEIVTVKPKRYSQRSKNVDPNALREKVREKMSMEDYSGPYHGSSGGGGGGGGTYQQDPNYPANFNPYAQEFPFSEQDRHYDQQMQQMVMLQQMSRSYSHPPPPPGPPQHGNTDYIQQAILHQQQLQQQQAAMMATYMQAPSRQLPPDHDIMNSHHIQRSNKAIPIVDPTAQIHMAPVIHET